MDSHLRPPFGLSSSPSLHPKTHTKQNSIPEHHHQDVLNNTLSQSSLVRPTAVKIPPSTFNNFVQPPHPTPPSVPRELNSYPPLVQDASVVITDSNNQTWLPSSSPSLPASSEHHPQQSPQLSHQQDFVLFPPQNQPQHSRPFARPGPTRAHRQNINQHRHRNSDFLEPPRPSRRDLLEGFYANSAPTSTVGLNKRQHAPPVPLFSQTPQPGANNKKNMELGKFLHSSPRPDLRRSHHVLPDIDLEPFVGFEGGANATEFTSPAQQNYNFDLSSSVNSSHFGTVSPNDLFASADIMSHPGSAALTALTTPSGYDGSPAFTDAWENSPLFATNETPDTWTTLFPDAEISASMSAPAPVPAPTAEADQSPSAESDDLEPARRPSQVRKSSASGSPTGRHSSTSGVNPRRRGKPLPPITIDDPSDVVSMKRAKNTLAARKSRQRKAERMDELEKQISELKAENEKLQAERDQWKVVALSNKGA